MKSYEMSSTSRVVFKGLSTVARLDGKNFSKFTKGLKRPFDDRLIDLMTRVTSELVDRFHATCGFTQSDEITLVWFIDSDSVGDYPFSGWVHKFDSLLAATASIVFNKMMSTMYLRTVLEIESFKLKDQPNMIDTIFNAAYIVKGD